MLDLKLIQIIAVPLMICDGELLSGHTFPYMSLKSCFVGVIYTSAISTFFYFFSFKEHAITGYCFGSEALLYVAGAAMSVEILVLE